jgi:hypothetical protein
LRKQPFNKNFIKANRAFTKIKKFLSILGLLCFLAGIIVIEIIIKRVLIDLGGNC